MSHPKRPRDPNQLAKSIIDIATGEAEERTVSAQKAKSGAKVGASQSQAWLVDQNRAKRG